MNVGEGRDFTTENTEGTEEIGDWSFVIGHEAAFSRK
jgi:hypothetical protein